MKGFFNRISGSTSCRSIKDLTLTKQRRNFPDRIQFIADYDYIKNDWACPSGESHVRVRYIVDMMLQTLQELVPRSSVRFLLPIRAKGRYSCTNSSHWVDIMLYVYIFYIKHIAQIRGVLQSSSRSRECPGSDTALEFLDKQENMHINT